MTFPPGSPPDDVPGPRPGTPPGSEPADPWTEDEARRRAAQDEGWVSESGGLGPIPGRTWRRGNSRVVVGGCCLPLPIGCLTTVVAAAVVVARARRAG